MAADLDRYLSVRAATGGAHTADGARVAFLTDITGVPQLWTVPAGGGWPDQATFDVDRVQAVLPARSDAGVLVFARDAGGDERAQLHAVMPDGTAERALVVDPGAIHRLGAFTADGGWLLYCTNARNGTDFDLCRVPVAGGAPQQVAALRGWNAVVDADARHALVAHAESNADSDLWLVDLDTGAVSVPTAHRGVARHLPGGLDRSGRAGTSRSLYLRSDRDGDHLRAYRLDERWVPFGPDQGWDVEALTVAGGSGALVCNEDGRSRLLLFDPATLETTAEVALPLGVVEDPRLSEDGTRLAFTFSGPRHNPDVWVADTATGAASPLTRSSTAGLDPHALVEPELVRISSFDGLEVPTWVYRPRGAAAAPVIVSVHGGPEAQARPAFNALHQYFVACGYAVVVPNVRGSTGYGKHYERLDDRHRRMDAVADLAEVAGWVQRDARLDHRRIALMGASYGGFMVLAALSAHPQLWAAGVDIVGIADLVTFLESTGEYRRALREAEYGSLAKDRELLRSISPLTHVDRITAPLLVIHGANDPRVPVAEAQQIVDQLRARRRTVECLIFDDEGHGLVKLVNRRKAYGAVAAFLGRHV